MSKDQNLTISQIHVWSFDHTSMIQDLEGVRDWLSADETARAERFVSKSLQDSFMLNRAFLRGLLARYLGIHPKDVKFTYGVNGKPDVQQADSQSAVCFNMAHSGTMALCAVGLNRDIGIDLEQIRAVDNMDHIAERFFAPEEAAKLSTLHDSEKRESFFKCWTAKEAFIKATGEGLSRPLDSFIVSFLPGAPTKLRTVYEGTIDTTDWDICHLQPAPGFVAALVTNGSKTAQLSMSDWANSYFLGYLQ